MKRIGILNGPNLERLGRREPKIYGTRSLKDLEIALRVDAQALGVEIDFHQSNHEGSLIERIYRWADAGFSGLVINPAAYAHTSIALRDAISGSSLSAVEVHISNIYKREEFRHNSLLSPVCLGVVSGLGLDGYHAALYYLATATRHSIAPHAPAHPTLAVPPPSALTPHPPRSA